MSETYNFSRIELLKKTSDNKTKDKITNGINVTIKCTECPYGKFAKTCPVSNEKSNSLICDKDNKICIAIRDGYDIGTQLLGLQTVGFFDPADYAQEVLLVKLLADAKANVKK